MVLRDSHPKNILFDKQIDDDHPQWTDPFLGILGSLPVGPSVSTQILVFHLMNWILSWMMNFMPR